MRAIISDGNGLLLGLPLDTQIELGLIRTQISLHSLHLSWDKQDTFFYLLNQF